MADPPAPSGGIGDRAATTRWLLLFLLPVLILSVRHWGWSPEALSGDYAQYLLHARALVEGRPYTDIGYIYNPTAGLIGPPAQPPGLPLTLAPIVALDGVHSPLVRLLMIATVVGFALLAAWRLSREMEPWQAALGAAFAAYAMEASLASVAPISDPGFAVLFWATTIVVDRRGTWTWGRVAAVTALGFAALSYRLAGVALLPGLLGYALLRRRDLGWRPLVPVLIWTVAAAVALSAGVRRIPFVDRLPMTRVDIAEHLRTFARQYRAAFMDALLYPFPTDWLNDLYHVVGGVLALLGLGLVLWRMRRTFLASLTVAYALLLLVAPVAEPRYAWPLYPVAAAGMAVGAASVLQRIMPSAALRGRALATSALGLLLVLTLANHLRQTPPASLVMHADAQPLFAWLTEHARADSSPMRLAFFNPRVLTLETRIPAMGLVPRTPPGQMSALARLGATHLIWLRSGWGSADSPGRTPCVQLMANRLPEVYPERFALEYRNATFRVYRVTPGDPNQYGPGEHTPWFAC